MKPEPNDPLPFWVKDGRRAILMQYCNWKRFFTREQWERERARQEEHNALK